MMLDNLGEADLAARIMAAVERVTAEGRVLTPDLGGTAMCSPAQLGGMRLSVGRLRAPPV